MNATYLASNQFSVSGDYTSWFSAGRRIKADMGLDGLVYVTVDNSVYVSPSTIVTIKESTLLEQLAYVMIGASSSTTGSLPDHTHASDGGSGGVLANYLRLATSQVITAAHTFNPATAGAPFIIGTNGANQLIDGLNAERIGGLTAAELTDLATISREISQTGHGFAVGTLLRHDGTSYIEAQATSVANAAVIGIVSEVLSVDSFVIVYHGFVTLSSLTAGTTYYLDNVTAGGYTATQLTSLGLVDKPVFIALSTTEAFFSNFPGSLIKSIVTAFDNASLSAGQLTITHSLSQQFLTCQIFNNSDVLTAPTGITMSAGNVVVNFTGMTPLTGTWHAVLVG